MSQMHLLRQPIALIQHSTLIAATVELVSTDAQQMQFLLRMEKTTINAVNFSTVRERNIHHDMAVANARQMFPVSEPIIEHLYINL